MAAIEVKAPRKGDFRQRAHCNPLADTFLAYPPSPDYCDWSIHYPALFGKNEAKTPLALNTIDHPVAYPVIQPSSVNGRDGPRVQFLDVGCGYGGLLVSLSPHFPSTLMMGMEIREKVSTYVGQRIRALRAAQEQSPTGPPPFANVSILRTNVMKFMPNYFRKGQLSKLFFCFPDPQFKRSNWRRRIVTSSQLATYAYVLRPGGLIYTATDVPALHAWMRDACMSHPLFEPVTEEELRGDVCVQAIKGDTEEGKKVARNNKQVWISIFKRLSDDKAKPEKIDC